MNDEDLKSGLLFYDIWYDKEKSPVAGDFVLFISVSYSKV